MTTYHRGQETQVLGGGRIRQRAVRRVFDAWMTEIILLSRVVTVGLGEWQCYDICVRFAPGQLQLYDVFPTFGFKQS